MFVTVFTGAAIGPGWMQYTSSRPISVRFVSILSSYVGWLITVRHMTLNCIRMWRRVIYKLERGYLSQYSD